MEHERKWRARKGTEIQDFRSDVLARVLRDEGWEVWELVRESEVFRIPKIEDGFREIPGD